MAGTNSKRITRAKLTDHEIDLIRELHESGMSYEQIAKKFEGKGYVRYIARRVEA
jgi:hypothetical protein